MKPGSTKTQIPVLTAGINLKQAHYEAALHQPHEMDFFEFHAENFMDSAGPPRQWLSQIAEQYPISLHGVCLSIGGAAFDRAHLAKLKALTDEYDPALVSEHLAWSAHPLGNGQDYFFNDLIAPPLTAESFRNIKSHIEETQNTLGRQILIENPSSYIPTEGINIALAEPDFLNRLAHETGCGLLLDINNIFVSAANLGFAAEEYLSEIDAEQVGEIHLAGHARDEVEQIEFLIDDHGSKVSPTVWTLYESFIATHGVRPTLIEWDSNVPDFAVLEEEISMVRQRQARCEAFLPQTELAGEVQP